VLVAGEAGIGKTALCRRFAAEVRACGGQAIVGHCPEPGAATLPYLPFVEALRAYVLANEAASRAGERDDDAVEVARLVPELRARLAPPRGDQPPAAAGADVARYRLFQGVTAYLRRAAASAPLLLVLEDLHDADRGTLDLLVQVAGSLDGVPLFVIGTYRAIEVDRTHPLTQAIAAARRRVPLVRLHLRGLAPEDAHALTDAICGWAVPESMADAVYRQSEGNPLFVQEVTRELLSFGLLDPHPAVTQRALTRPTRAIPDGLREVLDQRLARLGEDRRRLLATAAVVGRAFALYELQAVADETEETVVAALEAGVRLGVVEEDSGAAGVRYRFTHALFRQALYDGLGAARRGRLHQRAGHALAGRYRDQEADDAAELAEHFLRSPELADLARAVNFCEQGAQRAQQTFAFAEAARLLEHALQAQAASDPAGDAKRCDLLLSLGMVLVEAGTPARVINEVAPAAYALAQRLGDSPRAAHACTLVFWGMFSQHYPRVLYASTEAALWAERADRGAPPDSLLRVCADTFLAGVRTVTRPDRDGVSLATRALNLARRLDDLDARYYAVAAWFFNTAAPDHAQERLRVIEETLALPRAGVRAASLALFFVYAANDFFRWGRRAAAEDALCQIYALDQ